MTVRGVGDSEFSYLFFDLYTMQPLGQLPLNKVAYSKTFNGAGPVEATLRLEDPRVQGLDPIAMCHPGRTAMFVDVAGVLDWGGVIWTRRYDRSNRTLVLGGSELWSYIASRVQAKDYATNWIGPADPMSIAKTVIQDALAVGNSALDSTFLTVATNGSTPTTEWVSMSFPYQQLQTIGMIVSMMSRMGYGIGFDFAVDVAYDTSGYPSATLNLYNPRRGRVAGSTGLMLDVTGCTDWTWPEDATQAGNKLYETSTSAGSMLDIEVAAQALRDGYPLLERLIQHPNINSVPTGNLQEVLRAVALGDLTIYGYPTATPTATVAISPNATLQLGDFIVGDDLRFVIPAVAQASGTTSGLTPYDTSTAYDSVMAFNGLAGAGSGMVYDPRFPNGLDTYLRVIRQDVKVVDEGVSTFKLTLSVPPSATGNPVNAPLT